MALTQAGWAVRLRLPRWDDHVVERFEHAGIETHNAPAGVRCTPLEIDLVVNEAAEPEAREHVRRALRGWTVILPADFVASGPV